MDSITHMLIGELILLFNRRMQKKLIFTIFSIIVVLDKGDYIWHIEPKLILLAIGIMTEMP